MKKLTQAAAATALAAGILLAGGVSMATADAPPPPNPVSAETVEIIRATAYDAAVYHRIHSVARAAAEQHKAANTPAWSDLAVAQGTAPDTSTAVVEVTEQGGMGPAGIWLLAGAGVIAAAGAAGLATSGIQGKIKVRR